MPKNVECRITITEVDGKLAIMTNIPDGAESTIAGALAGALMSKANETMNELLGQNQTVEKIVSN